MKAAPSLHLPPDRALVSAAIALPARPARAPEIAVVRRLLDELVIEDRGLTDSAGRRDVGIDQPGPGPSLAKRPTGPLGGDKRRSTPTPAAAIIHSHWRGQSSLEETMLALYFGNLSSHRAGETVRVLWGESLNGVVLSACVETIRERLSTWLRQPIAKSYTYVFLESVRIKQRNGGQSQETALCCAVGVDSKGARHVLGVGCEPVETAEWSAFLCGLRKRGLKQVDLFVGGLDENLSKAVDREFPGARVQVCLMQVEHAVLARAPGPHLHGAMALLEKLYGDDGTISPGRLKQVTTDFRRQGLKEAAAVLECAQPEACNHLRFPRGHWRQIRTTDVLRGVLRPFRERIRVIGPIVESEALVLLAAARLRHVSRTQWSRGSSLKMK